MRAKINVVINFSIELCQRRLCIVRSCGSLMTHSGERHNLFLRARTHLLLIFVAINCLIFAAPTVVRPFEINLSDTSLSRKAFGQDVLSVTKQTGFSGPSSGKTNPIKATLKSPKPDPGKSTKASRKVSSNPYSASTLLAEHTPPLLEPTSDLATPLSGSQSPKTVKLFKRLYYNGKRMDRYQGRQFIAEGEAYHSKVLPKGSFMVFRWQIDCCTGEIEPVGIMVRGSFSESPNKTNWVNVDGFLEIQMIDGFRVPYLANAKVKKIPTPPPEKQFISF